MGHTRSRRKTLSQDDRGCLPCHPVALPGTQDSTCSAARLDEHPALLAAVRRRERTTADGIAEDMHCIGWSEAGIGQPARPLLTADIWLRCVALSDDNASKHTQAPAHLADDSLLPAPRHGHVVVGVPLSMAHGVKPAGEVVHLQGMPKAESVPTCRAA